MPDLSVVRIKEVLVLFNLTDYLKILETRSRPKFEINDKNEKLLASFKAKKLIYAYEKCPERDGYYISGYFGELSRIWRHLDEAECKEYELNCISELKNIPYFLESCKGAWASSDAHGPTFFNENFEGYTSTESLYEKVCLLKGSDIYNQLTYTLKNTVVAFYLWYASGGQRGEGEITEEKISEERRNWDPQ